MYPEKKTMQNYWKCEKYEIKWERRTKTIGKKVAIYWQIIICLTNCNLKLNLRNKSCFMEWHSLGCVCVCVFFSILVFRTQYLMVVLGFLMCLSHCWTLVGQINHHLRNNRIYGLLVFYIVLFLVWLLVIIEYKNRKKEISSIERNVVMGKWVK